MFTTHNQASGNPAPGIQSFTCIAMKVIINSLSMLNRSGAHVVLGHMTNLAKWTLGKHEYFVLYNEINKKMVRNLGDNVRWVECPSSTISWVTRPVWEMHGLKRLAASLDIDFILAFSGIVALNQIIPQVVFAQNPLGLVTGVPRKPMDRFKMVIQRYAVKQTTRRASMIIYNSKYMQQAYLENAGFPARAEMVVYQAIADRMREAADLAWSSGAKRKKLQILSVSAMVPHKNIEAAVQALHLLRTRHGLPASFVLVGAWSDPHYEQSIRALVSRLKLEGAVEFMGDVTDEVLENKYAESRVFCLMSRCESFGIPAVESQAFGTPVVSSNCCAIPEVCGEGGIFPSPDNIDGITLALQRLLSDDEVWSRYSSTAHKNSQRFRWESVSLPLLQIFRQEFKKA